ncbi:MAG: hypothetical protein K9J27_04830 [Bacteroidales bacterium]|nr:hypothetical protein [Bacteroidales bacterium]MCF8333155.1 hypothetical protein [Bacteroidales bacterium]
MNIRKVFLLCGLLLILTAGYPQTRYTPACKKAINDIAALRFEQAARMLDKERRQNPENRVVEFLEDYRDFLKIFISEDEALYEAALERREDRLEKIDNLSGANKYKDYMKGEIYLRWVPIRGKMGDRFRAAIELNKAYRLLKENYQKHPAFIPGHAGLGVIEVLIGTIPQKYEWLADLLNLEGTIKGGKGRIVDMLAKSESDTAWAFLEYPTLFMLSFIDMNIQQEVDKTIMQRYEAYHRKGILKHQPLLVFAYGNLLQKKRKNEKALTVLNAYEKEQGQYPFYYLDYMRGLAYLYKNSPKCIEYFDKYLEKFPGRHYIKSTYQKKAWYYLINDDVSRYKNYIHYATQKGEALIGADKSAANEAESDKIPDTDLLKARLAFDGGYYQQALKSLNNFDPAGKSTKRKVEWYYRKGRVFHEQERVDTALTYYEKTFVKGKDLEAYFAANAALMSGHIYEQKGYYGEALKQYEKCLDLSGFEYELSIHQKAEAGKARLLSE